MFSEKFQIFIAMFSSFLLIKKGLSGHYNATQYLVDVYIQYNACTVPLYVQL